MQNSKRPGVPSGRSRKSTATFANVALIIMAIIVSILLIIDLTFLKPVSGMGAMDNMATPTSTAVPVSHGDY